MGLRAGGKNLHLKVSLSDTELLSVLRERAARLLGKAPRRLERLADKGEAKSDVVAHFLTPGDRVTLTGLLNQHYPIHFNLKPETKTYENFIKFFLRELKNLRPLEESERAVREPNGAEQAVEQLKNYLESKLCQLERDTQSAAEDIVDIIDVFSDDLEPSSAIESWAGAPVLSLQPANGGPARSSRYVLESRNGTDRKQFRLVDGDDLGSKHISGFLSLEIEAEQEPATPAERFAEYRSLLVSTFRLTEQRAEVVGPSAHLELEFQLAPEVFDHCELFVHWGAYNRPATGWVDEEVSRRELVKVADGKWRIRKEVVPDRPGSYGATVFARLLSGQERIWAGYFGAGDLTFSVDERESMSSIEFRRQESVERYEFRASLLRALSDYDRFVATIHRVSRTGRIRGLGRYLYDVTRDDPGLRRVIAEYYHRAIVELGTKKVAPSRSRLRAVVNVLQNIGIGEVVFVAPEGPQAIAGGLAQVIVGLTSSLSRIGVSTTVVTPLYEEAQGSKHRSAEDLLRTGIEINGRTVPIEEVGEVRIPFGPTFGAGTTSITSPARIVIATVYCAQNGSVRCFFIRHRRLADRLYASGNSKDQLRRSIFLCRGALEVIRDKRFAVNPHIVVTNDWVSALVPVYLKVDQRYKEDSVLRHVECVHILHNCGRDYQGRLYSNFYGEDLYPMLGLPPEHYFGLSDPSDINHMNFTAGAVVHAGKALLAVSKPYAQQLLTVDGGEGLDALFRERASQLFGISNGIDLPAVREVFWKLGESARAELKLEPLMPGKFKQERVLKFVAPYKEAAKALVQRKHNLSENPDALLISLVGRLAEQKGVQLLSQSSKPGQPSVLESILERYPNVQFLIGGPPTAGDPAVDQFREVVNALRERFPGRIEAVFSFIPHREALEITQASDFFLMPSRFEPGGITQLEALACGTPVIARRVGGLAATLIDWSDNGERGNSFLFSEFTSGALEDAIVRAVNVFRDAEKKEFLIQQAAQAENDWSHRAPKHVAVLQHVAGVLQSDHGYPHLTGRKHLLTSVRP